MKLLIVGWVNTLARMHEFPFCVQYSTSLIRTSQGSKNMWLSCPATPQGQTTSQPYDKAQALMFAYHLINRGECRVPIIIELRGRSARNQTPEEIVAAWAYPYRINPVSVMKLIMAGRVLLILEGFDEMALVGESEARLQHF